MDAAVPPALSHFLQSDDLLPPTAKTPDGCKVGPNPAERAAGAPSWGCRRCVASTTSRSRDEGSGVRKKRRSHADHDSGDGAGASGTSFAHGVGTFLSSGCCVIPDVLPRTFVARCREKATSDLKFLVSELESRKREAISANSDHLLSAVQRGDFRELVDRDGGRRDVRFQLDRFPFTSPGLVYNPVVFPLVRELLGGGEINLLYAGVMWASPQEAGTAASPQKWHGDGGHLFAHVHLPPHCINVFYPLVDLTPDNGMTEFAPGTHRLGKFDEGTTTASAAAPKFGLCCEAGSAILFDYRLKHRGGSNVSTEGRPVLYLAYAKPFFRDAGNLRSGKSLVASAPSPPWVSRILDGEPVAMGGGFDESGTQSMPSAAASSNADEDDDDEKGDDPPQSVAGSGERWVLFRMNVELEEGGEAKTLTVYHGDVATEVSAQFCRSQELSDDFVPILAGTIQKQMDDCK